MIYGSFQLDSYLIQQICDEIESLHQHYGPERDVGPVTFELEEDGIRILIGTQKDGNRAYEFNDVGDLIEEREIAPKWPAIVGEVLWLKVTHARTGDFMPFGSIIPATSDWGPPEEWKDDYIPYPHGEETPEGPLRDLFGPRFPDLRAHVISDGSQGNVSHPDSGNG